jgi:hypothetical protein
MTTQNTTSYFAYFRAFVKLSLSGFTFQINNYVKDVHNPSSDSEVERAV